MGTKIFTEDGQTKRAWSRVGKLTTAQATFGTNASKAKVEALTATGFVIYNIPHDASAGSFRLHHVADGDVDAIEVWAIREGDLHYQLVQIIETIGGKQVDGDGITADVGVFVDTLAFTASKEVWPTAMAANSAGTDSIAMFSLNFHGYEKLLFIATTLADATAIDAVTH